MKPLLLMLLVCTGFAEAASGETGEQIRESPEAPSEIQKPAAQTALLEELIRRIARSGRVFEIGVTPSARVLPAQEIAPGPPPFLGFRYLEGRRRHRFANLDLVMDDAGH